VTYMYKEDRTYTYSMIVHTLLGSK
jgi:hypothetical protein